MADGISMWKQIVLNSEAIGNLDTGVIENAKAAAEALQEAQSAASEAGENLSKIIKEGEALTNHKERLDALDTKTDATDANVKTNTSNIATNTSNIATNKTAIETLDATAVKAITLGDVAKEHTPEDGVANIPKAEADGNGFGVVRLATGWDDGGAVAVMSAASILEKINDSAPDLSGYAKTADLTAETTARENADADLQSAIDSNSTAIADLQSASANYVDLTSVQTITGSKTFSTATSFTGTNDGQGVYFYGEACFFSGAWVKMESGSVFSAYDLRVGSGGGQGAYNLSLYVADNQGILQLGSTGHDTAGQIVFKTGINDAQPVTQATITADGNGELAIASTVATYNGNEIATLAVTDALEARIAELEAKING